MDNEEKKLKVIYAHTRSDPGSVTPVCKPSTLTIPVSAHTTLFLVPRSPTNTTQGRDHTGKGPTTQAPERKKIGIMQRPVKGLTRE